MIVIVPVFVLSPSGGKWPYIAIAFSRLMRIIKVVKVLTKIFKFGETDVSRQAFRIVLLMVLLIYIFSGVIMVLENINNDPVFLNFHTTLYFVIVNYLFKYLR